MVFHLFKILSYLRDVVTVCKSYLFFYIVKLANKQNRFSFFHSQQLYNFMMKKKKKFLLFHEIKCSEKAERKAQHWLVVVVDCQKPVMWKKYMFVM